MKKIDRLIRMYLARRAVDMALEPTAQCLSDSELSEYAAGAIDSAKRKTLEKHLAGCFLCLDKVASAAEGGRLFEKRKLKSPGPSGVWKAKNIERVSDEEIEERIDFALSRADKVAPATRKTAEMQRTVIRWLPKNLRKNRWLIASVTAFALSFAFPPVFLQFLVAAGILGGKWIFDSENTKILIMIYNAWKKGGEKEVGEMLEILKDRLPTKK